MDFILWKTIDLQFHRKCGPIIMWERLFFFSGVGALKTLPCCVEFLNSATQFNMIRNSFLKQNFTRLYSGRSFWPAQCRSRIHYWPELYQSKLPYWLAHVCENPAGRQYWPTKNATPRDLFQLVKSHHHPALAQSADWKLGWTIFRTLDLT